MDIERELRRNVKDLQEQLNRAYKRIKTLQDALNAQETATKYESKFKSGMSGWAMMDDPDYR
jgi:predicted RNase H-like nuclease (RuvC/YqgF family)